MLQRTSNLQSGAEVPAFVMLSERIDYVIGFLRRQYWIILICLPLALLVGELYVLMTPSRFTASATMMIDTRKSQFLQQSVLGDVSIDAAWIDTQIGVLKSENVASSVVKNLRLAEDPKFAQPNPALATLLPASISRFLGWGNEPTSEAQLARQIAAEIEARRLGISYSVRIDFTSFSPEQSVKIVNSIVDAYITELLNAKDQANRRTSDWLQERFQTLREQASAAERAVVEFKAKNNIVTAGGKLLSDGEIADLNGELNIARARTAEAQARLNRIQTVIKAEHPEATDNPTIAEAANNPAIATLRSRYLELMNREADWKVRYGENHATVVKLRAQMRDIRNSMLIELGQIAETYKSEYEISKRRQEELENRLAGVVTKTQDPAQIALHSLESAADSYKTLYANFLQRYMESVQQQTFPISEARLLSPASAAFKSYPRTSLVWIIAILAGGALGLGFGALRELLDGVFRTSKQVRSALDIECLALVPLLKDKGSKGLQADQQVGYGEFGRTIRSDSEMLKAIVDAPLSRYAEALRSIKLAMDVSVGGTRSSNVIGVTSSLPGEGKSTIAAGIAELVALSGARVILVDCDLRDPSLSQMLTVEGSLGLLDVVSGKTYLENAIWSDAATNMAFLPLGGSSNAKNSSDVFGADATKLLFEQLQIKYDYVIVDLSPLAPVVDVRAAWRLVSAYILVIEWGRTKVDMVQHALNNERSLHENIIGAVLNKVDMRLIRKYERKDAKYYRSKYFARYGYEK